MDDPSFYGFPTYGEAGPKIAQDCGGEPTDPDARTFERDEAAYARTRAFLESHLPSAVGPDIYTKTCLYTLTPDRDFVVDRLPDAPGVTVLLGAAHGFKFASVLGRIAAELSLDGETPSAGRARGLPHRPSHPPRGGARRRPGWSRRAVRAIPCAVSRPVPTYRHPNAGYVDGPVGGAGPPTEEDSMHRSRHARLFRILGATGLAGRAPPAGGRAGTGGRSRRPSRRHDAGPRFAQPVRDDPGRRLRGLRSHLQLSRRLRAEPGARRRVRRQVGASRRRPFLDVPHPGRHEVVRRPAGHVRGRLLLVPAGPRCHHQREVARRGLPRADDAGRRASPRSRARTPSTMVITTDDPSDRVLQISLPIIPKHIWGKETYKTIGKAKFDAPLVGTGPYTVERVADRPVHPPQAQPELLGDAGVPGRSRHHHLQEPRHDGPGAQGR